MGGVWSGQQRRPSAGCEEQACAARLSGCVGSVGRAGGRWRRDKQRCCGRTLFTERPLDFCKVVASILPRDFVIESNAFSEMDDRKLEEISALAQRLLEERIDEGDESGTGRTH